MKEEIYAPEELIYMKNDVNPKILFLKKGKLLINFIFIFILKILILLFLNSINLILKDVSNSLI